MSKEEREKKKKGDEKMWTHVQSGAWYRRGGVQISMLRHQYHGTNVLDNEES